MSFTITTKYMPATNTRGSRIRATMSYGKSVSIPYPHELSGRYAHDKAVAECLRQNFIAHRPNRFIFGDSTNGYLYVADTGHNDIVTFGA